MMEKCKCGEGPRAEVHRSCTEPMDCDLKHHKYQRKETVETPWLASRPREPVMFV